MKKMFFLIVLFLGIKQVKAQCNYLMAGQHGVTFVDISPDVFLPMLSPSSGGYFTYPLDINQDGTNDILISVGSNHSGCCTEMYVGVSSLDTNTTFSFGGKYTTGTCSNPAILKVFRMGDTIKNGSFITSGYLSYNYSYSPVMPGPGGCYSHGGADTGNYIGVRYRATAGDFFGWVKLNIDSAPGCVIKEFSLCPAAGVGIMGNKMIEKVISVYPNPSSNTISLNVSGISNYDNSTITIQNTLGETVRKTSFTKNINVSDLAEGCYFLQVVLHSGEVYKTKFIKQ